MGKKLLWFSVVLLGLALVEAIFIISKSHLNQPLSKKSMSVTASFPATTPADKSRVSTNKETLATAILFYNEKCPHCRKVEAFLKDQKEKSDKKIDIVEKAIERSMDQKDRQLLVKVLRRCHMNLNQVAIPLLWTGKTCVVGDEAILRYLRSV
jgi:glutaredoxin